MVPVRAALAELIRFLENLVDAALNNFWYDMGTLWYAVNRDNDLRQLTMGVFVVVLSVWWLLSVEQ